MEIITFVVIVLQLLICYSSRPSENKIKWKTGQIPWSCQKVEKVVEHEVNDDTNYSWSSWNNLQRPGKKTGGTGLVWFGFMAYQPL